VYFLLAGYPPFPEGSSDEKMLRKQTADPTRIDEVRPDVPQGLADVIHGMLARSPADRPATPAAAAAQLSAWADPGSDFPQRLFAPAPPPTAESGSTDFGRAAATERITGPSPGWANPV
jgi:serine/threonine-protein kinase